MKRISNILMLALIAVFANAQEKKDIMYITFSNGETMTYNVAEIESITFDVEAEEEEEVPPTFPAGDSSPRLNPYDTQNTASSLLRSAGIACTDTLGRIVITNAEYQEIKQFTDNLVKGCTTQKAIHDKCFNWITSNVKYGTEYSDGSYVNNDPYPVFTKKIAVCQGYSNLLFTMLHSQGVPVLVTNGYLNGYGVFGGHAWNYVNCDGKWIVSDPTNGGSHSIDKLSDYWYLQPSLITIPVYEDENFKYNYFNYNFNISRSISTSDCKNICSNFIIFKLNNQFIF